MKPLVATTGGRAVVEAAVAVLGEGNAVDAVAAGALAWPPSLASAGALLAFGAGIGRIGCRFQARVPGLGLSRPRRVKLFAAGAPAAATATPSAATALAAALARWGRAGLPAAIEAALASAGRPHAAALELLAEDGAGAFVKGPWATEAARVLGPLAGGLLTRRDFIEARPWLGEVEPEAGSGLLVSGPVAGPALEADRRLLCIVAADRLGGAAALVLDAGPPEPELPRVSGVEPNTLLAGEAPAAGRRVGRSLALGCGCAGLAGELPIVLCGRAAALGAALRRPELLPGLGEVAPEGVLLVRGGPRPEAWGAEATGTA